MANELQEILNSIQEDKNTNLLPENLKTGTTCLGVNGTLLQDTTALPVDVALGKTFYSATGKKTIGQAPNIEAVTHPITDVVIPYDTGCLQSKIYCTALFFDKLFYYDNGHLYCRRYDTQTIDEIDVSDIITENVVWLDVGCLDVFRANSLLIVIIGKTKRYFYSYDYSTSEFIYEASYTTDIEYQHTTLNPYEAYAIQTNGSVYNSNQSSASVCKINADFTLTNTVTITGNEANNSYYFICLCGWFSRHCTKVHDTSNPTIPSIYNSARPDSMYNSIMTNNYTKSTRAKAFFGLSNNMNAMTIDEQYMFEIASGSCNVYKIEFDNSVKTKELIQTISNEKYSLNSVFVSGHTLFIQWYNSGNYILEVYSLQDGHYTLLQILTDATGTANNLHTFPMYVVGSELYVIVETSNGTYIEKVKYNNVDCFNTSDADVMPEDIMTDKIAYNSTGKIIGVHEDPFYFETDTRGINVRFGYVLSPLEVNNGDYTVTSQSATYNKYTYKDGDGNDIVNETSDIQFQIKNNNVDVSITNKSDGVIKCKIYNKQGEVIYTREFTNFEMPDKGDYTWFEMNDHNEQSTENMTKEQLMNAYSFDCEVIYEPAPVYNYTISTKLGSQDDNAVEILSGEELTVNSDGSITLPQEAYPLSQNTYSAGQWQELNALTLTYIFKIPNENRWSDLGVLQYAMLRMDCSGRTISCHTNRELDVCEYTPAENEIIVFNLTFDSETNTTTYYINGVEKYTSQDEDMVYGHIQLNKGSHVTGDHTGIDQTVYGVAVDITKAWTAEEVATYYNSLNLTE